jgi:hypothetical protein
MQYIAVYYTINNLSWDSSKNELAAVTPYYQELLGDSGICFIDGRLSLDNAHMVARRECKGKRNAYKLYKANRLRDLKEDNRPLIKVKQS